MDNKLYAGSYLSSWREQLDEIAQQRPLHKTEKALRELITVKGQLQAKIERLEAELDKWKPKAVDGIEAYREVKK